MDRDVAVVTNPLDGRAANISKLFEDTEQLEEQVRVPDGACIFRYNCALINH